MKDMEMLSTVSVFILVSCFLMLGCQSDKVQCRKYPNKYQFVKEIENQVFALKSTNAIESITNYGTMPPIPDYFDFGKAVEAYEEGRLKASRITVPTATMTLSVYGETNLVAQALRDGFEGWFVKDLETIRGRNIKRKQLQNHFFGLYLDDVNAQDNLTVEEAGMTTNCYVHLLHSYVKGYQNGYRVVTHLGKSPIVRGGRGLATANLGSNMLKRAYVYGWYSACYDFFRADPKLLYIDNMPQEGDPRSFYKFWLSFFMELEGRFLRENAAKKETVNEEASGISK